MQDMPFGEATARTGIGLVNSIYNRLAGTGYQPAQGTSYAGSGSSGSNTNALAQGFNTQKQNIYGSAQDAARNAGIGYKGSILDFVDSLRTGQQQIDNRGINNELAKQRGTSSVLDMVGRGIRSGGVMLANRNASDSSAAGALSRAYGDIGRRNLSQVGNEYELENREIGLMQGNLDAQRASGMRKLSDSKEQIVGNIVQEARNALAQLDASMANASLPERIAIENEKEAIRQQVLGELSQFDQMLASETDNIRPMEGNARIAEATRLNTAGAAPSNMFNFDSEVPAQFQNTGPFASELPIFTYRNRRN